MRYLVFLLLIFSFFSLKAQDCPPGDVTLLTQAEVDTYVATFPNCTTINGDLRIGPSSNSVTGITDISSFSMLTHIMGSLTIREAIHLSSLNGLEQLEEIGGNLVFDVLWQNDLDISALDHPITIGGKIFFDQSFNVGPCTVQAICDHYLLSPDNVSSLSGSSCGSLGLICLPPSDCPPGDVTISSQADINFFAATYPNCTVINGDFEIVSFNAYIGVYVNITVPSLPALERIEGGLDFSTYTDMTNGFTGLTYVGGDLGSQINLGGIFPALDTIGGDVYNNGYISTEQSSLTASFPALKYVGGGFVTQGSEGGFIDSDEFPVLERIEGGLYDCTAHSGGITLSGFPALKYIGGDIEVENGAITGMNMLDTIAGSVTLRRCDFLSVDVAITGLNELDYVGGGGFSFGWKHCVSDLSGLCNYFSNGGSLSISESQNDCSISEAEALLPCTVCPTGDVILSTQQEIDEFSTTYPSCTTINGDLTIAESSPGSITNLNGLNQLDTIYGAIYIHNNDVLADISGLEHVVYSEITNLGIYNNAGLSACSLANLCNYLAAGGASDIHNNLAGCNSVSDIQANCLECPPDNVELFSQQDITDFMTLYPNCTTINGDLNIQANINDISLLSQLTTINASLIIQDNNNLSDLAGLQNINLIGGSLVINNCDLITDLNGLNNISSIGADLTIFSNDNLSSLAGLENISSLGADLTISFNDALSSLAGLENISSVGGNLTISSNGDLSSLAGLENITSVSGHVNIHNGKFTNLSGLNGLSFTGNGLSINNIDDLINLSGLENVTSIGGDVNILNNNDLLSLEGLSAVTSIGGKLEILNNAVLLNLNGLDNLTTINVQLNIKNNDALLNMNGLNSLISIGGRLEIFDNYTLVNLVGLESLTSINGGLWIADNDNLASLTGLGNVDYSGITSMRIFNNPNLSTCEVLTVCNYINTGGSGILVLSNATGCNNVTQIESACDAVLPIEMADPLRVHLKDKTAILQWRTDTEINNAGFEWEKIGWQAGQGNTTTAHSYTYTDRSPLFGTSYYRFKQVDFNGDTAYSNIVNLQYIRNGVIIYPNPVKELLYLHTNYSSIQKITIYNSVGSQVAKIANPGTDIDVSALPKGIYVLKITVDDEDFYEKILVE